MPVKWNEIKKRYWPPRKDQLLILVLFGLLLAVIAIPADREKPVGEEKEETAREDAENDYETRMEQKLGELLSRVEGVGNVEIMLTFEGSGKNRWRRTRQLRKTAHRKRQSMKRAGTADEPHMWLPKLIREWKEFW